MTFFLQHKLYSLEDFSSFLFQSLEHLQFSLRLFQFSKSQLSNVKFIHLHNFLLFYFNSLKAPAFSFCLFQPSFLKFEHELKIRLSSMEMCGSKARNAQENLWLEILLPVPLHRCCTQSFCARVWMMFGVVVQKVLQRVFVFLKDLFILSLSLNYCLDFYTIFNKISRSI